MSAFCPPPVNGLWTPPARDQWRRRQSRCRFECHLPIVGRRVLCASDLFLCVRAHTTPNAPVTLVIDIAFEFGCNFTQIMYRLGGARCLIKFVTGRDAEWKNSCESWEYAPNIKHYLAWVWKIERRALPDRDRYLELMVSFSFWLLSKQIKKKNGNYVNYKFTVGYAWRTKIKGLLGKW